MEYMPERGADKSFTINRKDGFKVGTVWYAELVRQNRKLGCKPKALTTGYGLTCARSEV